MTNILPQTDVEKLATLHDLYWTRHGEKKKILKSIVAQDPKKLKHGPCGWLEDSKFLEEATFHILLIVPLRCLWVLYMSCMIRLRFYRIRVHSVRRCRWCPLGRRPTQESGIGACTATDNTRHKWAVVERDKEAIAPPQAD
ncbi:hypothetical protein M407DRAFT_8504 [Tulasnella calospora MUT 4182]|uniref:Uncharacterized protein n=1 Tax=Tulasnella calospora MUT 4182 TaxID=1051891 RepID=A0A0C3LV75_9AGAM|nr:hypothetical protein M407DRAFT_8504 [Tulasnella calospora MUT 4182]